MFIKKFECILATKTRVQNFRNFFNKTNANIDIRSQGFQINSNWNFESRLPSRDGLRRRGAGHCWEAIEGFDQDEQATRNQDRDCAHLRCSTFCVADREVRWAQALCLLLWLLEARQGIVPGACWGHVAHLRAWAVSADEDLEHGSASGCWLRLACVPL